MGVKNLDGSELELYALPTITFVGGETQIFEFHTFFHTTKNPFDLKNCTARFAVVHYLNRAGTTLFTKNMSIAVGESGLDNVLTVELEPADTLELSGKYVYQISIKDGDGATEIPKQGLMYIIRNIDQGFIS